jgi:hypothetical protein
MNHKRSARCNSRLHIIPRPQLRNPRNHFRVLSPNETIPLAESRAKRGVTVARGTASRYCRRAAVEAEKNRHYRVSRKQESNYSIESPRRENPVRKEARGVIPAYILSRDRSFGIPATISAFSARHETIPLAESRAERGVTMAVVNLLQIL